ncbi:myosin-10-like [Dreissena polymorpha]|uniref:myosin-10-like n=1 Tax=Dreissena polymorpha TaxID=45954 RepID=UPI002264AEBE|nr:myosin-10-like [Dreissena polymorpha]
MGPPGPPGDATALRGPLGQPGAPGLPGTGSGSGGDGAATPVQFADKSELKRAAYKIPIGTLAFVLNTEQVYIRVSQGWRSITPGNDLIRLLPETPVEPVEGETRGQLAAKSKLHQEADEKKALKTEAYNSQDRLVKSRRKPHEDDENMELEKQRSSMVAFEKKQPKFDHLHVLKRLLQEKDAAEKESRDKETKILNLNTNAKQKQENDMKDFKQQVEAQMKDFGCELDEAGCARDEMQGPFKGNEKRLKTLETDNIQLHEKRLKTLETDNIQLQNNLAATEHAKSNAEAERDALQDEISNNSAAKSALLNDKHSLKARNSQLEIELEEKQFSNADLVVKTREATMQFEKCQADLRNESQRLQLEVKDLKEKLAKVEGRLGKKKWKVATLKEQLDLERKERGNMQLAIRRLEKKLKEERRNANQYKDQSEPSEEEREEMQELDKPKETKKEKKARKKKVEEEEEVEANDAKEVKVGEVVKVEPKIVTMEDLENKKEKKNKKKNNKGKAEEEKADKAGEGEEEEGGTVKTAAQKKREKKEWKKQKKMEQKKKQAGKKETKDAAEDRETRPETMATETVTATETAKPNTDSSLSVFTMSQEIQSKVIKGKIKLLLDQLCDQFREESFLLMACLGDGSLSHLRSRASKGFLKAHKDIKSQFLEHCLTREHKKSKETRASPIKRQDTSTAHKRQKVAHSTQIQACKSKVTSKIGEEQIEKAEQQMCPGPSTHPALHLESLRCFEILEKFTSPIHFQLRITAVFRNPGTARL